MMPIWKFYSKGKKLSITRMGAVWFGAVWLLIVATFPVSAQDELTFTASVDRTSISTDDVLTLNLTLKGTFNGSGQPEIPAMEGFTVVGSSQSSQFSMVNGKMSSQVVFVRRLAPIKTGSLTIPSISIQVGGETYQTQAVAIEVTQGAAPQAQAPDSTAQPDGPAPTELEGQDLFVKADVDNPEPVVGEQIIYRFYFYQAVQLYNQPRLDLPQMEGFVTYELAMDEQYYQQAAGRQYLVTVVKRALFATVPGRVTIEQARLTIPGGFFNSATELETGSVEVNVQPLPENAPEAFSGAVGQFEIESWVEPVETRVNEPVTLFVRVGGVGDVTFMADPTTDIEERVSGWRVYDPQVSANVEPEADLIHGEKVFERLLVPTTAGELSLPSFELAFYDPSAAAYQQVSTEPLVVPVSEAEFQPSIPLVGGNGKQEVVVLATDIRHIKPAPPALEMGRPALTSRPLYWFGWLLPALAVTGVWFWNRRRDVYRQDVALARSRRALSTARKRLADARKLVASDEDAAYAAVASLLHAYLGDKFNLPAAGLTRDTIQQALGVDSELASCTQDCLDWADSGRFAPVAAGREVGDLVSLAEQLVAEIEEVLSSREW